MPHSLTPHRLILKRLLFTLITLVAGSYGALSQISISGPVCINAGTQYSYTISGNWNTGMTMNWSVSGGVITGSNSGTPLPQIHVTWNSGVANGTVTLSTSNPSGSASLIVNPPPALSGGTISNPSQNINYNTIPIPPTINCSQAVGGSCSPSYSYQWQQSADDQNWSTISGVNSQDLTLSTALTQTMYYKRMVIDASSGDTAYSDNTATVFVYPELKPGSVSPAMQIINYNTAPPALTLTGVSGGNGSYYYQWQSSATSSFSNVTNVGTNSPSYSPPALTSATYYQVIVTSNGVSKTSGYALVDVYPQLIGGTVNPSTQTITYNTAPPSQLTVSAPTGGNGTYSYQWLSCSTIDGTYTPTGNSGTSFR